VAKQVTTVAAEQGFDVQVWSVSCTEHNNLCRQFDVKGYPQLRLFPSNATEPISVKYWEAHPFEILNDLGIHPTKALEFDKPVGGGRPKDAHTTLTLHRSKSDLFHDAHLSFHFALKQAIFMDNGPLQNTTKEVFWDWLTLLRQSMPPTWEIQNLLKALLDDFETIVLGEEHLVAVADRFPPPRTTWSQGCSKGEKGMGYTCGLWELFHIMSVGVVEWNLMIYDSEDLIIPVDEVSVTLRNYVEQFFGCEVCRMNFLHGFDSCARDRCTRLHHDAATQNEWVQLPLWLFEFHNGVNVRLLKERAERDVWVPTREDELKVEWPPRAECPKCWRDDGGWNEDMVYKYLRIEYWLDDAIADVYRRELLESDDDDEEAAMAPPVALQVLPLVILLGLGVAWYVREHKRRQSGRHKRMV
jgi:hypothetical protein